MNVDIQGAFRSLQLEKEIPADVLKDMLEAALLAAYERMPDAVSDVHAVLEPEVNRMALLRRRTVVDVEEPGEGEVALEEARALRPGAVVGDIVEEDVTPNMATLGRLAAGAFRQVLQQKTREIEHRRMLDQLRGRVGRSVLGEVDRAEGRNLWITVEGVETLMPGHEQIPGERWRAGDRVRVFLVEVRQGLKGEVMISSRSHAGLVRELFALEVPEVADGVVRIESIAREAGQRTKVAVRSRDRSVDAVGACIGSRGARIQAVMRELGQEKIDVVRWSPRPEEFVAQALAPAKVRRVDAIGDADARVVVPDNQLSLAIGKEGQNVRLASRLTGRRIDIRSERQAADEAKGRPRVKGVPEVSGAGSAERDVSTLPPAGEAPQAPEESSLT
ncbi:MAG: transcription termination factor NusA [Candidatus Sericytochromatia bacterium]|nr:transcription termination factor NusA [Candidatus Sericytochromatia bacterium]